MYLLKSNSIIKLNFSFSFTIKFTFRPLKTDSAPVHSDGYKPRTS